MFLVGTTTFLLKKRDHLPWWRPAATSAVRRDCVACRTIWQLHLRRDAVRHKPRQIGTAPQKYSL